MKAEEILIEHAPGFVLFEDTSDVIKAMEEYAKDQVETTIARYKCHIAVADNKVEELTEDSQNLQGEIRGLHDMLNALHCKAAELEIENNRLLQERKQIIEENASMAVLNLSYQCKISRLYNLLIENKIEIPQ